MCVYTWLVHTHLYFHFHHLRRPSCTSNEHTFSKNLLFLYLKFIYLSIFWRLITLQYCIDFAIHWHGSTCVSHPEHPSHFPPHPIPLGHPSAPALNTLYHASNLDWWFVSHVTIYTFQCHSPIIILPLSFPTDSKRLFYTSVSFLLSRIQSYDYHLSKLHIYALVYCIGVFLSGLLYSV